MCVVDILYMNSKYELIKYYWQCTTSIWLPQAIVCLSWVEPFIKKSVLCIECKVRYFLTYYMQLAIIQHQIRLLIQHLKDKDFYINYDSYLNRQNLSLIYIQNLINIKVNYLGHTNSPYYKPESVVEYPSGLWNQERLGRLQQGASTLPQPCPSQIVSIV